MRILINVFVMILLLFGSKESAACIDSLEFREIPVSCFGQRNGKILIDKISGGMDPFYYSIDGESFSTNPIFENLWAGYYTLYIRDGSGCISSFPAKIVEPEEIVVRLQANAEQIIAGESVTLRLLYSPETIAFKFIHWEPESLFEDQNVLKQQIDLQGATDFTVSIADTNGCAANSKLNVEAVKPSVYIPNAIKIGSDEDAYLTIFTSDGVNKVLYLKVFNRLGAAIFEERNFPPNDPTYGWDGRVNDQRVQSGVYVWLASIELSDGTIEHFDGTVTVVE